MANDSDPSFLALFEGALIVHAGVPVREMYEQMQAAHGDDAQVSELFGALKADWDDPAPGLKMVRPFAERAEKNPDYRIAAAFSEVAAETTMVDAYWTLGAHAYLLKKHLLRREADETDVRFARETLGALSPEHPVFARLFSLSAGPLWKKDLYLSGHESATFAQWTKARGIAVEPSVLPSRAFIEKQGERIGLPALAAEAQDAWDLYFSALQTR